MRRRSLCNIDMTGPNAQRAPLWPPLGPKREVHPRVQRLALRRPSGRIWGASSALSGVRAPVRAAPRQAEGIGSLSQYSQGQHDTRHGHGPESNVGGGVVRRGGVAVVGEGLSAVAITRAEV